MSQSIQLRGITWDHTRGYLPMVATAQRFSELHPEIEITWQKRSLKAFGDQPIQELATQFDLLVIDHPFVGYASTHPVLQPLNPLLPAKFLAEQESGSVGASHPSYTYAGQHWALAIDAATPVASWRADLLAAAEVELPETWDDLLLLAKRGLVAVPGVPIDSLMNLYMLCLALGEDPFVSPEQFAPTSGVEALKILRELLQAAGSANFSRNPIQTYEALVRGDAAYCPFAYGYSNYARTGYSARLLSFGGLVTYAGQRLRSTLGGTGLAIAANCRHLEAALAYAQFVAEPTCQQTLYTAAGGQPGHRSAWESAENNMITNGYFQATLPTLDQSYLRPRYNGYANFQDEAAPLVQRYLRDGGDATAIIAEINHYYQESQHSS